MTPIIVRESSRAGIESLVKRCPACNWFVDSVRAGRLGDGIHQSPFLGARQDAQHAELWAYRP
jgi:hypothetical protein